MNRIISLTLVIFCIVCNVTAQDKGPFIKLKDDLIYNKQRISKGDPRLNKALKGLKKEVQVILKDTVSYTVIDSKKPSSISPNNYYSLARYEWPNPNKKDGLPYIGKDGKVNPEIYEYEDRVKLNKISNYISKLSLLYFYTGDEKLVLKAKDLLSVFFINESTRMNPNLNYSQITKGNESSTGGNIVDANGLINLIDAIKILEMSENWSNPIRNGLESWFTSYFNWLIKSPKSLRYSKYQNNIGVYHTAQVVVVALYINKKSFAKKYLRKRGKELVRTQINIKGELVNEYGRSTRDEYIQYSFAAFNYLNSLSEYLSIDLYNYQNKNTGGLKKLNEWIVKLYNKDIEYLEANDFSERLLAHMLISKLNKIDRSFIPHLDKHATTMQILSSKD